MTIGADLPRVGDAFAKATLVGIRSATAKTTMSFFIYSLLFSLGLSMNSANQSWSQDVSCAARCCKRHVNPAVLASGSTRFSGARIPVPVADAL
jgi:hypothetical protein